MTTFYWIGSTLLFALLVAVVAQEVRYLRARRDVVADRQELFHASSAFHVVTLLSLSAQQELLAAVRSFVDAAERSGAKVVYAGKIAVNAMASSQLPDAEWDAFVLVQYPSRQAYHAAAASPELQKARASFATTYAHGMERSPWLNLAIPIGFLGMRVVDLVKRTPPRYPFPPASPAESPGGEAVERSARVVEGLLANREYGSRAVAVLNFIKKGSPEQRRADAGYAANMFSLMAEVGNGPTHIGRAVTLEGDAEFDDVAIVYYPGVEYFAALIQSPFFRGIVGGKQLGDTLASPSVPLLPHL